MTKKYIHYLFVSLAVVVFACREGKRTTSENPDTAFSNFENRFLDAYWKQNPSYAISVGYGKYYDELIIPDSASVASDISFCRQWIDSLNKMDTRQLSDNNKISLNIIKNQLEGEIWYQAVFKQQEWDPSSYNLSAECDYIINQPYAPLDERLTILTNHLQHADEYYKAALNMLHQPTKEHLEMAIQQNEGGLSVFGSALTDSINASHLPAAAKLRLQQNIEKTTRAINIYISGLKDIVNDKNYVFRSFRIGKDLFAENLSMIWQLILLPNNCIKKH